MGKITTFKGYLLKFGDVEFPTDYLLESSYRCTPNQRTVIDTFKSLDNITHRDVHKSYKTKIEIDTDSYFSLDVKAEMQDIFRAGLINEIERLYTVTYWNDETNKYATGKFFMDDIQFTILEVTDDDIIYDSIKIVLQEQ